MGFQINTNVSAMSAYRNLSNTQNSLTSSLEKLSSGLRINKAADDAAGLSISEGLRAQIGGLTVASRNAQDGISVVQTAEGALGEVHSNLQRLRDLAVQAGNDSNNAQSRAALEEEATALVGELDRIAKNTNFNGISLLKGDVNSAQAGAQTSLTFQVGAGSNADDTITVDLAKANVSNIATALNTSTMSGSVTRFSAVGAAPADTYTFSSTADGVTSDVSVTLAAGDDTFAEQKAKLEAAAGFSDLYSAELVKNEDGQNIGLDIRAKSGSTFTVTPAGAGNAFAGGVASTATSGIDFSTGANARLSIERIDAQIQTVSEARSNLGAVQNRFETAINSIAIAKENLSASESRIRDTDMASEMANFTRANILQQAGTSMLAQANSLPQSVLSLLG